MTDRWETLRSRLANDYQINLPMVKSDISAAERLIKTPDLSFRIMDGLGVSPMASQDEKLVPDLEDLPFDQLKADPQLPIKQIEQNFEEGLKYLRDCSILRSRYTEVAKDYVDTKLKIEEFWRLDEIHKLEEQNGVYEVALHDAEDERDTAQAVLKASTAMRTLIEALMDQNKEEGLLSPSGQAEHVRVTTELTQETSHKFAEHIRNMSNASAKYRSHLERRSWDHTLLGDIASEAQMTGKKKTADRHILRTDAVFRKVRTSISRDVAYRNLQEHERKHSPLHYPEHLNTIRKQYSIESHRLAARIRAVHEGCTKIYGLDVAPLRADRGEFFDAAVVWIATAQEQLGHRLRNERVSVRTVWLSEFSQIVHKGLGDGIDAKFSFAGEVGLLRGIDCEFISDSMTKPIRIDVTPPAGAFARTIAESERYPLRLGRVMNASPGNVVSPNFSNIL